MNIDQGLESIRFEGVSTLHPQGHRVLQQFKAEIRPQEVLSLSHLNQEQKVHFFLLLQGTILPHEGDVYVNSHSLKTMDVDRYLHWKKKMAFVFENGGLLNNQSLEQNILLPHLFHGFVKKEQLQEELHAWAKEIGLVSSLKLRPMEVPMEKRKWAGLLRSLLGGPELLCMNRPTQHLRSDEMTKLWEIVQKKIRALNFPMVVLSGEDLVFTQKMKQLYLRHQGDPYALSLRAV